jgi:hypothetical protein
MGPQVQEIRPAGDETRGSLRTIEFWIYVAAVRRSADLVLRGGGTTIDGKPMTDPRSR